MKKLNLKPLVVKEEKEEPKKKLQMQHQEAYTLPEYDLTAFNCPICGAYAKQEWEYMVVPTKECIDESYNEGVIKDFKLAECMHCNKYSVWYQKRMIYPLGGGAPLPNSDLPEDIKEDYDEARSIYMQSPRGAAALLRLVTQKLCKHLGETGIDLNADISNLVTKKVLPKDIIKALDIVRVVGNEAVHPGEMDIKDDVDIVRKLFGLVNVITDQGITQPKEIEKIYNKFPENKRNGIKNRDKK